MTATSNFIAELSWSDYQRRLQAGAAVLLPVGANEQHGHHLPLGTDTFEVLRACQEASRHGDFLIAPAIPFGYASQPRSAAGNHWPGNISLRGQTMVSLVSDVLRSVIRHGATDIAVIDAHYENGWFLLDACEIVGAEIAASNSDVRIVRMMCWDAMSEEAWDEVAKVSGPVDLSLAHAGVLETAAMLHTAGHTVHMDRCPNHDYVTFPPYDVYPPDTRGLPESGVLSSPTGSTAELGEIIMTDMGRNMARLLAQSFDRTRHFSEEPSNADV